MVNIELANKVLDQITNKPKSFMMDSWVQGSEIEDEELDKFNKNPYSCGTTACVAGWASILHYDIKPELRRYATGWVEVAHPYPVVDGVTLDWEEAGIQALGISRRLAKRMFYMREEPVIDVLRDLADGVEEEWIVEKIRFGRYGYDPDLQDCGDPDCTQCV